MKRPVLVCALAWLAGATVITRIGAATLEWTGGGGDGSWHNPANWTPAGPPGADDDVLLSGAALGTSITLTNVVGGVDIRGFTNLVPVSFKLRATTLRIRGEVELNSGFALEADESDVSLVNPAILLGVSSRSGFTVRNNSTLNITRLTEILGRGGHQWEFNAASGSRIELPELRKIASDSAFSAVGSNAVIRLPKLAEARYVRQISAGRGGSLVMPALTILSDSSVLRQESGYLDLAQLEEVTTGSVELQATNITFSALAVLDGFTCAATLGSQLSFPALTEWIPSTPQRIYAQDAGSRIEFPNLQFLVQTKNGSGTTIEGLIGGQIRLPNLLSTVGNVNLNAGSQFASPGFYPEVSCNRLETMAGGSVYCAFGAKMLMPRLRHAEAASFVVRHRGYPQTTLAIETLEACPGSMIQIHEGSGYTLNLGMLTNADNAFFEAYGGGIINLPSLKTYKWYPETYAQGGNGWTFRATGAGGSTQSQIVLPELESVRLLGSVGRYPEIRADQGGLILASKLETIVAVSSLDILSLVAENEDSEIQFPSLSTASGLQLNGLPTLKFIASNGGVISLSELAAETKFSSCALELYGGAVQRAWIRTPRGVLISGSKLTGSGHFEGDLVFDDGAQVGVKHRGAQQSVTDKLFLDGEVQQGRGGTFEVTMFDATDAPSPIQLRQVKIAGEARIAGRLAVDQFRTAVLQENYELISWDSVEGEFSEFSGLNGKNGLELKPSYADPQRFVLTTDLAVPPSVLGYTPVSEASGLVDAVSVTFSESMLPEEFTAADVVIKDPAGDAIPVLDPVADPINLRSVSKFIIPFRAQTNHGTYTVVIGPNILDFAGIPMTGSFAWQFELSGTPPAKTFEDWRLTKFNAERLLDPLISGPGADPDGDGLTNEQEYQFCLDQGWNINPLAK
ncbi:MAG TPA: hypothetical protein DCE44_04215, partial [Verrucomicrobiales bacterium]|nr:hypothetical protein [Verrucomicrobiales bacterium]